MFALLNKSLEHARHYQLLDKLLERQHQLAQRRRSRRQLPPQRRKILFESLEPRLLMSADLLPAAVQGAQKSDGPVNVQITPPSPPQINWTAPITTGDAPLYASGLVSSFDLDNFSSPLAPVAPGGGLVYAGGVQGSLDFDGDSDTLTIALDGNQSFTLRLKPPAGLQARIEAFEPNGNTLGALEAANTGDTLVLQLRSATDTGSYSIQIDSLAGAGNYTVEIFLNAALEAADSADAGTALNLDGVFSALLDSDASRAAMLGSLSTLLPTRVIAEEDFQDGLAFEQDQTDGIWALEASNPDALVARTESYGEVPLAYLGMRSDQSGDYSTIELIDEGGTTLQDQYIYEASLGQATWRLDLSGVTQATLEFDRWGYDPNGHQAPGEDFVGSANFDGVSVSTDGNYWVVLQEFGPDNGSGVNHSTIDLVQAATAHGLTLGSDTRIRFQFYDAGGTFTEAQSCYRNFDNIRLTTDQQQLLLTPAGAGSPGTEGVEYNNNLALLTDGFAPTEATDFNAASNLHWFGQEVIATINATGTELAPSAGVLGGLYFDLDLGSVQHVTGLLLSVDNNDDYAVDYSLDGANWARLVDVLATSGNVGFGMDTLRYTSSNQPNGTDGTFTAVQAHYLRFYATAGDGTYAIGELQAFTSAATDAADWYSLTLDEGDITTFTLSLENTAGNSGMRLDLYDQDLNLVTSGLPVGGQVVQSIQDFRAPAAGTYTLRISGNTTGDYNLVAIKQAVFGASATTTQDLTLTPVVLDRLSGTSGSSGSIRVAVLGGGNVTSQLNDDTYFNFSATAVEYYNIDTAEELDDFDVVVIGASQNKSAFNLLAPVLRPWVEAGHGLVASGWSVYYAGASSGDSVNTDIDAIVPVNLYGSYQANYSPTVQITNNGHPVTLGVTDFSSSGNYVEWSSAGVDVGATILGTTDGNATIVVGQPGAGRSVYLGPVYPYYNWSSGMADRLLEQAVAWAGPSGNAYTVQARAGTDLTVTLDLLGAEAEQPLNDLAPELRLYDSSGNLLASGTTFASHSVLADASFTLQVSGAGSGDYLLRVAGDIPAVATPLQVVSSTLDGVGPLINFPNRVDITFSQPVLYTSLGAADLLVNGNAAESFTILSPTQVRFSFANTFTGDGDYLAELLDGSVTDIHGNPNQSWAHAFSIDAHGPTVNATSVSQGATLEPGIQIFSFLLSEALATSELTVGDVQLRETLTNQLVNITGFDYNGANNTLTLTTAKLAEGAYQLTLFSGYNGFKDVIGNTLDGNADGVAGDNFTLGFSVDVSTLAYPAMQGLPPAGSLVYDPLVPGVIHAAGDVDTYTVSLDAGQTMSVLVSSVAPGLQIEIAVLDADDGSQVALVTGTAGETVALQALPGLSGNYRVEVRGLSGGGSYGLSLILNALLEQEMLVGTAGNDSIGTAQDIASSSLDLGSGGSRLAVVGDRFAATNLDDDVYRIQLGAGQMASVGLAWTHNASGELLLDLVRADGTVLAIGANDAGNAQQAIRAFVATDAADYYLRVRGSAEGTYNLVVTRGMSFSLPSTQAGVPGQDISLTGQVLGSIGGASGSLGSDTGVTTSLGLNLFDASGFRWDIQRDGDIGDGSNDAYDGGMNHLNFPNFNTGMLEDGGREVVMGPATIGGVQVSRKIYVPADQSYARFLEVITNNSSTTVNYTVPISTNLGSDGNERFVVTSSGDAAVTTADNWLITDDSNLGASGADPVVTHVVAGDGRRINPATFTRSGDNVNYSYSLSLAPGQTQIVMHFASQAANQFAALAQLPLLTALGLGALNGMSSAEKSAVMNFNIGTSDFLLQVNMGDVLQISTITPGDGAGEPANTLNPSVELLGPNGSVLASDANSGADGRNTSLTHTALTSGTYTVRVLAESGTGDFVLRATGATGVQPPLAVTGASITEGQVFNTPPTSVDLSFSQALRADSVQASDLNVNGVAAVGVIQIDADTLRFDISGLVGADGAYTLSVQDSAVTSLTGTTASPFSRGFFSDGTAPTVTAASVAGGETIAAGARTLVFTFSEDLASTNLGAEDVLLTNTSTGVAYTPASFAYSATTDQITVQYASLPEGAYTLTLLSGTNGLRDLVGNALDGDPGNPGPDSHVLRFIVDDANAALPDFNAFAPLGGLVYRTEVAGRAVHATTDTDSFTVTLDAGQTLTLWASQVAGSTRLAIELFDAQTGGSSLGLAEASSLGQTVLLQTLAVTGGSYRVEVRSLEGSGQYSLKALLNAALENESIGGAGNNSLATAQDLTASLISTGSDRAAVVGQFNETAPAADWYSVHLDAGQSASAVLTPDSGLANMEMGLALYDTLGNLLTSGTDVASNVDEAIIDFVAPSAGNYYLRVSGSISGQYGLVLTRGQSFSLEQDRTLQDISQTGEVLGALGGRGDGLSVRVAVVNNGGATNVVNQLNDDTYFNFSATSVTATQVDTLAELANYDVVMLGDSNTPRSQLQAMAPALRQWVESGGGVVGTGWLIFSVGSANGAPIGDMNAIFPVDTSAYYAYLNNVTIDITDDTHPVTSGVADFATGSYVEYSPGGVDAGATVLGTVSSQAAVVVGQAGNGRSVYLGPTYLGGGAGFAAGAADRLLEQAANWVASDQIDGYLLQVNAGDNLHIRTSTPFDGPGQPNGRLDVRLELLDETGAVVASNDDGATDGRNAVVEHLAASSGAYTVRVMHEMGSARGEYVLRATGATGAASSAPRVITTNPVEGKRFSVAPTSVTLDLSEGLLAASVGMNDLAIDGGASVTGVELVDGDTVRFLLTVPDVEGTYSYILQAGGVTDLQGTGNLAYSGSFFVDKTAPRVVSQAPEVQSISPFTTWSLTFSEALNPSTVQAGDFVLKNPNDGTVGISNATVSADGLTVTVVFGQQFMQGNYSLTVGTDILDVAGNRMDQDAATAGNQTYLGAVQVASPDLSPVEVSVTLPGGGTIPEGGVALGSQVRVTWTVRNIGTDAARSGAWYDSLWISTDTNPANDVFLGAHYIDTDPTNTIGLPAGEQYTMSALVTVPLNNSFNPVNHFIRVQTDGYYSNYQPENNENNNGLYSAAFATVVPPLPDLTVSNVTAPELLEAGKAMTLTWTVNNNGAAASPAWHDRIVLSADTVYGNADDVYLGGASDVYSGATLAGGASLARSAVVTVPAANTGTWNVLVRADVYDAVYERAQENNNVGVSVSPLQVVVATEDLTPTAITAPDSAVLRGTITVAWSVQNAGSGPTYSDWYDRIVLSTDEILGNGDDRFLAEVRASSAPSVRPLAAGASYSRSLEDIPLPLDAGLNAGNYYLLVKSDYYGSEPELNENNNVLARPITLSLPQIADLSVSGVTVPQAPMSSGDTATVRFTLHNTGNTAASNFHNYLYLSSDGNSPTILVGDYYFTQALAAGASVTVEQTITVPLYRPGAWYLLVVSDAANEVYEHTNEDNNRASSLTTLNASLPPLPDLLVSNILAPLDALAGGEITITWTVTNQGSATSGPWTDSLHLSTDGGISNSILLDIFAFEGTLSAGASVTRTQVFRLDDRFDGLRTVVVTTDASGQVDETHQDIGNNRMVDNTRIRVSFPPLPNLQVTALTPPTDPASGTETVVSWIVTNNGTGATSAASWYDHVRLSLNTVWGDGDDIDMGIVPNPNYLSVGESYANSHTISIPKGLNGDYHFLVKTDTYDNVEEDRNEGDNILVSPLTRIALTPPPDLRVQRVEADNVAFSGENITVSWTIVNDDRFASGRTLEAGWADRVIMSSDDVLGNADDRNLGDFWHVGTGSGALEPGESYQVTRSLRLPIGVVGEHYFFVIADVNNHVYEHGFEFNNSGVDMLPDDSAPEATSILLTPPPDLEVMRVTTPGSALAGNPFTVSWQVGNFGSEATRNNYWVDRVYLSVDGALDGGDILLGERGHSGALERYEEDDNGDPVGNYSYTNSATFTLPFGISGNYRVIVRTDATSQVFEGLPNPADPFGENNNTGTSGNLVVTSRPADLVVSSFAAPSTGEAGRQVSLNWTVTNQGSGSSVTNLILDRVYVSRDEVFGDADDILLDTAARNGVVQAGGSYAHSEAVTLPLNLVDGTYWLYVRADAPDSVYELDETNNLADRRITVTRNTADLQVTRIGHDATGTAGQGLAVDWRVDNEGSSQTNIGYWYDAAYLSLDQTLDGNDALLGARYRNSGLGIDQGYDAVTNFTVPSNLATNDYFIILRTDRDNQVTEGVAGELNNILASSGTVHITAAVTAPPDLVVLSVDAPDAAISGQSMTLNWTVRNSGTGAADNRSWYDAVYLSRDGVLDRNADIYLGYASRSGLGLGESYTQTLDVAIPYGQSGPFYAFVVTDAGRHIPESDEFNNATQDAAFTQVSLAPPADLVVGTITLPDNGVPGRTAAIGFSINNNGVNPAMGSWSDSVYLSIDETWDINDALFGVATYSGTVAGGSSYSNTVTDILPGVTPGDYHVIVRSDIRNHIPESNEANNIGGSLDTVALDVDSLTMGVAQTYTLGTGQAVYYKFEVAAGETVRITLDSSANDIANELFVRHGSMPTRGQFDVAAREGFTADPQLVIPTTEAGTYYVLAYGQYAPGSPQFSIRAEIIPFSITEVDARVVSNAGNATLRIQGAKFGANTDFSLLGPDGHRVYAYDIQLDSSSEAYASFKLFQTPLGSYSVIAEQLGAQPDGSTGVLSSTSLANAVTVREAVEGDGMYMNIAGPTDVMVNRTNMFTMSYVNDGGIDVMAPLIIFEGVTATPIGLSATSMRTSPVQILAASYDGPMDILRPGARYSVPMVFQSPDVTMALDMRAGRIMSDDIRLIEDWDTIEASIRPLNLDSEDWGAFWGRVQPLIGSTWGDYVTVLNSMMLLVSEPGQPIRGVRDIFTRLYALNPDYVPYAAMRGEIHDAESDIGLADVQVAAYLVHEDGRLEHKATTITNEDGLYSFARLMPGTYKVVPVGRALDMDRNGRLDQTAPQFTLSHTTPGNAGTIYVQPLAGIGASNDSNPVLDRDSSGTTHMVWTRDGIVWHAWYDLATARWKDAQAISTGESYAPAIASSEQLFHDAANQTSAGTVITWQQGRGNASEIWYAAARAKAGGGFEWSAPVQTTSDDTLDVAPEVIIGETGLVMITHLKRDGDIQDDTDIYYDIFAMSEADFTWPAAVEPEVAAVDLAPADAVLDPQGVSVAYGRQWKFGPWDFFGTEAEIVLALSGQISEADCKATLGAQGQISGSFKGSSIRSTISGNGNVAAEWSVNEAAKDWQFNSAKAGWGASAQFDWRYGLSTLLSKIPHPAVTSAYLAYSLAVGLAGRFGLTFEDGITFGGGASFSDMEWTLTQPFPDFIWPESIGEASLSGTLGVYAQLDAGPDSARLQGDITVTVDIAPAVQLKSITGNITFSGNIGWFTFNEVFSISFYSASGMETADGALQTQDASEPIFDPGSLLGSTALHGTNHLLADAGSDLAIDSAVSMARDGSVLFGAWTHMADPNVEIGSDVMVSEYAGSWTTPVTIAGALGLNSDATAAVDAQGRRMVLWTHAASSGLNGGNLTLQAYEAALDSNNVVFATYDELSGSWSAMQTLAVTEGMDTGLSIGKDASGGIVASWVRKGPDTLDHLMTATWNGSGWSAATEIAAGASIMDPAIEQLGDGVIVMWEQDGDPDPDVSEFTLHYSIFTGTAWSAGAIFDPIAMATGLALSAGMPVAGMAADTSLDTQALFPPFPVPEECLKCKPEEIKRIRESAPVCRDGGGTVVTFDSKTCTEKTIVYRPCVVRPRDPNDIIGPEGYGDEGWIAANSTMGYMIRFENAADASAPAQEVVITQQLDSNLDWRTFRIDDFGFGDQIIEVDGKSAFYQKRLDFTGDLTRGYFLDVSASVDISTGIVTWKLTTIDPNTGDMPQEASIGFLPVNDTVYDENQNVVTQGTGRGEGYVTYTVKALRNAGTGTVVDALALIVFDTEEPIETPAISHTLDALDPESSILPFETTTTTNPEIRVQWGGQDDAEGSGVRDYVVWVSANGGDFEVWLVDTELTEAIYIGEDGNTYSFFTTARDNAGNEEDEPAAGDVTITITGATGGISGTKFEDDDGDGIRDAGETGLAGWTIYLDANSNSAFDTGEASTVTGVDGSYSFLDLDPGAYTVREVALAGWVQTTPGASGHTATVVSGETRSGTDFGNFALAQIGGQLFSDRNANGARDDGEESLSGWTLTLDRDGNGSIEATTTTDAYGYYRFTGVGPGSFTVMQVAQAGWLPTGPASGKHTVLTTSGADIGGADFANVAAASISGTKFEDVNGNGERDIDERGLSGWTIFLDANANGGLDGSERFMVTGSDGAYAFGNLLPGSYVIAEVMQDGWVQTSPGAGPSSATAGVSLSLSGMDVVLSLPEDVAVQGDISAQAASANALADTLVGLDAFRADPRFAGITGAGVTTVVIDTGIDRNHSWFGPDADNNGIAERIVFSYDFADNDDNASDLNGHGSHIASLIGGQDATYGGVAQGADLIALKVFGDDGSGYFSYLEKALQWVVLNAAAFDVGVINLSLGDGGNWDTAISRYGLGDELAALAGMNILITAASGNNYFQYSGELGVAYPAADPAVLAVGAVWSGSFGGPVNYANGAADYSTGADRLAAFGQRDDLLLDILAPGTRMVGANYNGGIRTMFGTSQASAYMAGIATLAQDLALDHLGRKLSMAEFSSLLASTSVMVQDGDDEHDNVENTGLDFARIDLLALAEGILAITPDGPGGNSDGGDTSTGGATQPLAAPGVHQFSLAAGEQHTGTDFGNFLLGSISGTVFDDRNANASQDGADAGLGGWTVFLDGNANGQRDTGEHGTVTLADGSYRFNGIGPGSYHVSLIGQDGWTRTTAAVVDFPMTSGLQADADFGVNALPTLAAIGNLLVNEGSMLTLDASGTDDAADSLIYSLAGDNRGATIDAATGVFSWLAPDGNASAGFTLRVTDGAGGIAERGFVVTVANVAPSLTLTGAASVTDDQDFVLDLASSDPGQDTLTGWTIQWGDGSSSQLEAAAGNLAHRYAAPGDYTVLATASDEDGSYSTSTTVTVLPGTLKVSALTATATGFQVRFNRGFVPGEINLVDSSFYNRGAADIALRDAAGRNVAGSVVLDDDHQGLTFVRTGGLLANGSYTVTLDSRSNAFATAQGGLLDGNRDGTAGDHFSGSFSVAGSGAVLRIGEFARGPGQAVDVPATAVGVPITISGATGAQQVSFTLAYDPALLAITGVSGGAGMPSGSTAGADFSTPGEVRITLSLGSALGAGSLELVRLSANVPGSAPYGAKQLLDLRNISLDTGAAVRDDDGLHLVAYLGDTSGNAKYSTLDVQRIQRAVLRMDSGFGAYPLIDPVVVADINGNGALSSLDAQRVLSEVMGLDRAEIPPIPRGMTLTFSGPDPVVSAASVAGMPGDTVVVPITLDTAAGLESVEITLLYPADSLELLDVRLGGLTQDFPYFVKDTSIPGRITIDMARMSAMAGGAGTLVELEFRVADDAQGILAIDLQATALNETRLTLNAESQPGPDPTDGRIVLPVAQAPVVVVSTTDALVAQALAPEAAPATALPSFGIASAVVQPLPQINFSQPASAFGADTRSSAGWVSDWVAGSRDTGNNPLKLNNWKLGAPVTRIASR